MPTPDPSAELRDRPDRCGCVFVCHGCYATLPDCDPLAFVDGEPYCLERCVIVDHTLHDKPHFFVCTRDVGAASVRFDYTKPATTIHIRTAAARASSTPIAGKPGPRIAWIRELRDGRPIPDGQGQGALFP